MAFAVGNFLLKISSVSRRHAAKTAKGILPGLAQNQIPCYNSCTGREAFLI